MDSPSSTDSFLEPTSGKGALDLEQAEAALRQSLENHQTLLRTAMDGYWRIDLQGRLVEVNQAYCDMSGYTEAELLEMSVPQLDALEDPHKVARKIAKILRHGALRFETRHRRRDGSEFDVEISVQHSKSSPDHILAFLRDISDRKAFQRALQKSEQRLSEAQRIAHLGWWELDLETNHLEWSEEIFRIFEIDPARFQASYQGFLDLIHPDDRSYVDKAYTDSLKTRKPYDIVHRLRMPDGRIKVVQECCETTWREDGTPARSLGTVQDITERRAADIEKERLQSLLGQAQRMESVGRLAGGVAHDFNNMLCVIIGRAEEALSLCPPTSPLHNALAEIMKAGERSADLTRQLLAFARQQTATPQHIDLNLVLEGMLKLLRRLIGENIEVVWRPCLESTPVLMDPSQLDQVLANLMVNARDAIEGSGVIEIHTERLHSDDFENELIEDIPFGDLVQLTVKDSGRGMDASTSTRVFEPFFTTKGVGQGTGLGLATVYGIVKQNGGSIDVRSTPKGGGTIFRILLPVDTKQIPPQTTPHSEAESTRGEEGILLVEDEELVLEMITAMLETVGHKVFAAQNVDQVDAHLRNHPREIHLMLTDVVMPGLNGREMAERARRKLPDLKVVYMSGYTSNIVAQQGILPETVNFVQKPFSMQTLLAKVRSVLDNHPSSVDDSSHEGE